MAYEWGTVLPPKIMHPGKTHSRGWFPKRLQMLFIPSLVEFFTNLSLPLMLLIWASLDRFHERRLGIAISLTPGTFRTTCKHIYDYRLTTDIHTSAWNQWSLTGHARDGHGGPNKDLTNRIIIRLLLLLQAHLSVISIIILFRKFD